MTAVRKWKNNIVTAPRQLWTCSN